MRHRSKKIVAGMLCVMSFVVAVRSAPIPQGLGCKDSAAEKALAAQCAEIVKLVAAEKPDYNAIFEKTQAARKAQRGLLPEMDKAGELDALNVPEKTPLVCYGKTSREDALQLLREQLNYHARSTVGIVGGDKKFLLEWTGRPGYRKPDRRQAPMVAALRETARAALMLSRPIVEVRVQKGDELFADDFSKGAGEWQPFGQCKTENEGDAFRLKDEKVAHPDAMMWTKKKFGGDFLAEFTFIPHTEGTSAGALFTICGTAKPGKTLAVCVGRTMQSYNNGINGYHFSMHRGATGLGNMRRVGPGLKLLMSGKDPCPKPGQAYQVAIGKVGSTTTVRL